MTTNTIQKKRKYIKGNGKEIQTKYGSLLFVTLNLEDLKTLKTRNGYVKLIIAKKPAMDKYGNTHYIYEGEWLEQQENKQLNGNKSNIIIKKEVVDEEKPF